MNRIRKRYDKLLYKCRIKEKEIQKTEMFFGYFIGPFGALLTSGIFACILQNYFTDVLKLDLGFLTTLQLGSTILIVAANLVAGQLIEKTRTPAGKARPWILISALTLSVSSILMFIVPFEGTARIIWMIIAYNLFFAFAYPIYNTANSMLIPLSTRNSKQRGVLASLTNVAGLGVMGAGSMVFPILASLVLKENRALWAATFLILAWISALSIYLQFIFTRERVTEEAHVAELDHKDTVLHISVKEQLKAVIGEKMWWIVILFYIVTQWCGAMKNVSMSYFCKWVLDNSFWGSADAWGISQSILSILGAVPMAVAAVFVVPLCNRYGKRNVCILGMLMGTVGGVIAAIGGERLIPVGVGVALKCLGTAPACYMILAMLADVIDYIEYKKDIRTDGLTMSVYSSVMIAGTSVCNAILSAILNLSGYNQNAGVMIGINGQTEIVRRTIWISYIGVDTIGCIICAVLLFFFNIEKE